MTYVVDIYSYPFRIITYMHLKEITKPWEFTNALLAQSFQRQKLIKFYIDKLSICKKSDKKVFNKKIKRLRKKEESIRNDFPEFFLCN